MLHAAFLVSVHPRCGRLGHLRHQVRGAGGPRRLQEPDRLGPRHPRHRPHLRVLGPARHRRARQAAQLRGHLRGGRNHTGKNIERNGSS